LSEEELAVLRDLADTVEELLQQRQTAELTKDLLQFSQAREERYRNLIEGCPDAFLIHAGGKITFINHAGLDLLGAEHPEQLLGKPMKSIVVPEHKEVAIASATGSSHNKHVRLTEQVWQRLDGTRLVVETFTVPFVFSGHKAVQVIARDVTERKHEQQELERLSTRDILTGLPNRTLLMDRLQSALINWQRHGQKGLVAVFDIDHFKEINDTLGQSAGDQVLMALAKSLSSQLSNSDTIARISGDVFVLVLEGEESLGPSAMVQRIFDQLAQPLQVATREIFVTCSVGYCRYPYDGDTAEALLSCAQAAMYRAKEVGRANIQAYRKEMRPVMNERFLLETQLRQAIERHELELYYQPKVRLDDGRIVGVEALVRWQHPEQGMIPPLRFIPLAEETGLIVPMGEWITQEACEQVRRWQDGHISDVSIAINLSSKQFLQPSLVQSVRKAADKAGIDPQYLEFELTESLAMGNPEKSASIMNALKDLGASLSVDDFGTGYSNLSHLIRFPVDKIKIDQSFIRSMMESMEAQAIVKAIISMGLTLRLTIVAEGVETEDELALLSEQGCHEIQGYYFCKPLPAQQCSEFILSAPGLQGLRQARSSRQLPASF
jgi:diguanylate cyclase (GGDEF)-like protein/PAS domain S-box-containing protein